MTTDEQTLFNIRIDLADELAGLVTHFGYTAVEHALADIKREMDGPIPSAPARHTDPRTSHAAAKTEPDVRRFGRNSAAGRLLSVFAYAPDGLTDYEATTKVIGNDTEVTKFEGVRRRCSDLRRAGYIADSGTESDTGRIVWKITAYGDEAFYRMKLSGWSL
jgi:hypothetical protein